MASESLLRSAISADSHVTEPPNCYTDRIERKYRDAAPHVESDGQGGDTFVIEGLSGKVPYGLIAAAGKDPAKIKPFGVGNVGGPALGSAVGALGSPDLGSAAIPGSGRLPTWNGA